MNVVAGFVLMLSAAALPQDADLAEASAAAQAAENAPLFADHGALELTLSTDFRLLKRERGQESIDRPAEITLAGSAEPIALQARTRGNFRLRRSTCPDMPPVRLNFPTKSVEGTVFEGQDKVKLVTHCRKGGQYEQNTLQEFVAYRIYNLLTDRSFRVRLARVTYVDTSGEDDDITRYAFLIEDEEQLAARLGGIMLEPPTVHPLDYVQHPMLILTVFQYMIGNTDWSMVGLHNVKLIREEDGTHYPIPYDFDWSGLVNARYAEPAESLGIRNVRTRLFRGFCLNGLDYEQAVADMQGIRAGVFSLIAELEPLDDGAREDLREYMEDFYEVLDSEDRWRRRIERACREM